MSKNIAVLVGVVFLLIGILSYIPGVAPTHSNGLHYLLGVFRAGGVFNIVYLVSGALGLVAALASQAKYARPYLRVFGVIYALFTILGFIQKTTVLGIFHVNTADNVLNLVLAVVLLVAGFALSDEVAASHSVAA